MDDWRVPPCKWNPPYHKPKQVIGVTNQVTNLANVLGEHLVDIETSPGWFGWLQGYRGCVQSCLGSDQSQVLAAWGEVFWSPVEEILQLIGGLSHHFLGFNHPFCDAGFLPSTVSLHDYDKIWVKHNWWLQYNSHRWLLVGVAAVDLAMNWGACSPIWYWWGFIEYHDPEQEDLRSSNSWDGDGLRVVFLTGAKRREWGNDP